MEVFRFPVEKAGRILFLDGSHLRPGAVTPGTHCCGMFRNTSQMRGSSVSILTVHGCGCTVCGRHDPCDGWSLLSESTLEEAVDARRADTDLLQINKVCLKQGRP